MRNVLLVLVVIVAGLGIGILSAVVMHRGENTAVPPPLPVVTPLPLPQSTASEPQPLRTLRPAAQRTPPAARATPSASAEPSVVPTQAVTPLPTPRASASVRPAPTRAPTFAPTLAPTAAPTRAPASPAAVNTGFDVDIAQAIVRRYLDAIARGDNATARALLGASPNDATVPLPELAFVNTGSKIGSLVGRRTGDVSAAVEVQVTNGDQKYAIVYEVSQTAKGTLIAGRDITRL